jgi:hypothetical protein
VNDAPERTYQAGESWTERPGDHHQVSQNASTTATIPADWRSTTSTTNQLTSAASIGTVGLDWQFAGIGPVHGAGESDLVLRNKNTGAFEVYDIANNQLTAAAPLGAVGLDWQPGGFAADPPSGSAGDSSQVGQLVQAMAGFNGGSGAADGLNAGFVNADTSQQMLLTTPQHG